MQERAQLTVVSASAQVDVPSRFQPTRPSVHDGTTFDCYDSYAEYAPGHTRYHLLYAAIS